MASGPSNPSMIGRPGGPWLSGTAVEARCRPAQSMPPIPETQASEHLLGWNEPIMHMPAVRACGMNHAIVDERTAIAVASRRPPSAWNEPGPGAVVMARPSPEGPYNCNRIS
ncbi:hypothetical protein V2G26_014626 [Clonostachys chloroleuca]